MKIFILIKNQNYKFTILDIITEREKLNYILKFKLLINIVNYIN